MHEERVSSSVVSAAHMNVVDDIQISPRETYVRNLQKYCSGVDMGGVVEIKNVDRLRNNNLTFVYSGQTTRINIPAAFFLVNKLTGEWQKKLLTHVIRKVEETWASFV